MVLHYFHHFRVASIVVDRRPHLRAAGPFSFSATGEGHARPNHLSSVFSPLDPIRAFLLFLSLILHLKSPAAPRLLHIILWKAFARPLRAHFFRYRTLDVLPCPVVLFLLPLLYFHVFFFSCVLRVFRFPFPFQLGWATVGTIYT